MSAVIVVLAQMKRIVRTFRRLGATHPAAAIIPYDHNIRQSFIFQKLVRKGILVPVDPERYYLDEEKEAADTKQRLRIVFVVLSLVLLMCIVAVLVNR